MNSLSTTRKLTAYTEMFLIMYDLGFELDALFRNADVQRMVKGTIKRFDSDFALNMRFNVVDNIQNLYILAHTAPGTNCRSLGVRYGAV